MTETDKNSRTESCKQPHRTCPFLDEKSMDRIAERAAKRAIEKLTDHFYHEVGKSVVEKLFYLIGVCTVALYLWLRNKGVIS